MDRYRENPSEFFSERKKIVITDISSAVEAKAKDVALDKSTESTEKPSGLLNRAKNFGKTVWKRSEIFQIRERYKAEEEIRKSGNLFAHETGVDNKKAQEDEATAITNRFSASAEFEDEFIHKAAGESREQLGNSDAEANIKNRLQDLIRSYARGSVNEADFYSAKEQIFAEVKGLKPEALGKGKMYADNLLQIAKEAKEEVRRQVEQRVDHEAALRNLDLNFEVVVGKAKAGVRTEAQFNAVDKVVDKIQRVTGGMFNEYSVATAVAIVNTVFARTVQGSVKRAATFFGLGMAASGAAAAAKESRKLEIERMQHAREKAQGKEVKNPDLAKRRAELEESRIQTKSVAELEGGLRVSLFDKLATKEAKDLTEAEYKEALKALSEIDSRIQISDTGIARKGFLRSGQLQRVDLIGYSDITKVDQERDALDVLRARAKVALKKTAAALGRDLAMDLDFENTAAQQELFSGEKGIEKQNEIFHKLKKKRVWKAFAKGALIGGAIGLAVQEAHALVSDNKEGIIEHGIKAMQGDHEHLPQEHVTLAEGIRRRAEELVMGDQRWTDYTNHHDQLVGNRHYQLPEGYEMKPDGHGAYFITDRGRVITDPFKLNPDNTLTPEAQQYLSEHGFGPKEGTMPQDIELPGPDQYVTGPGHAMTLDEAKAKFAGLARHAREDWHDNPGKYYSEVHKKLIEFEGKQQNLYLEQAADGTVSVDGRKVLENLSMNVRTLLNDPEFGKNPDGTVDQKLIDLKNKLEQWDKAGTLQDHLQVAVIPTESANQAGLSLLYEGANNGKIALPPELSSMFTDPKMLRDGNLPFKFMELRIDGHVLATVKGNDIEAPAEQVLVPGEPVPGKEPIPMTVLGKPMNTNDFVTEPPFIIPAGRRKGLEEMTRPEEPLPLTTSLAESRAESGVESSAGGGGRETKDLQQDVIERYFGDLTPVQKRERLVLLQELLNRQGSPDDQRRFLQLADDFYAKHLEILANNPYSGAEAAAGEWDNTVDTLVATFPGYQRLNAQEKAERTYYLKSYLNKNRLGVPDDKKRAEALTVVRLLNIHGVKKSPEQTVADMPIVIEVPEKATVKFEANPFGYIYGNELKKLNKDTGEVAQFVNSVRLAYEITDDEYNQIRIDARRIPNRRGLTVAQKELAQIMKVVQKKGLGFPDTFKSSSEYERWAKDTALAEIKDSLNTKILSDSEINRIASESGIDPAVVIDTAVSNNRGLRAEVSKRTKAIPRGARTPDTKLNIQKQVLEEYQTGRLVV